MKPSAKPILLIGMLSLGVSSAGCSTVPIATGCSDLAAPILTRETPHAEIGNSGDPALDWQLYGTAETVQLNRANDDKRTGYQIIAACERRDAETRARIERPWWAVWRR
ncbi:hypothetical protein Q0812_13460 [Brevundimonas sp. 2R-24]|uniref:Lipoprotein n=1 Tax=Peiella sedimenti TaxID=3061083 RepID=A0ABT8SRU3_9CAUL|nr:hypothetical protein [Caulobacteraceae bacterium XZ-24]